MTVRWRALALAVVLDATVVVGVATAQTVIVTKAPPGVAVELVLNTAAVGSATADSSGRATLALDLRAHGVKADTDARIYVDVCKDLRRVLVVERAFEPPRLSGAECVRREITGQYVLRQATTLVVEVTESNPAVWLTQGPAPIEWLGQEPARPGRAAPGRPKEPEAAYVSARRRWELEAHGGLTFAGHPTGGSATVPATGAVVGGLISATTFSFGEGTRLFNQNQTAIGGSSAATITTLDPIVLGSAIRRPRSSGTVGARMNWAFREWLALEVTGDYSWSGLVFSDEALSAIEATRASYVRALTRALASDSIPSTVTSVKTVDEPSGSQLFTGAALLVSLRTSGKAIPYVVGGGGAVLNQGKAPSASVVGNYEFGAPSQVFVRDAVDVQYSAPSTEYVGIVGGGLKYYAAPRWGVRIDGRARILRHRIENQVDVAPTSTLKSTGSPFPVITSGALQFSSTAPMTGALLARVTTFSGSGYQVQVGITAGVFLRF